MSELHEKSLELLRKFLDESTEEERHAIWEKVKNIGNEGPTVEEYFESMNPESVRRRAILDCVEVLEKWPWTMERVLMVRDLYKLL